MSDINTTIEKFVSSWNEPDAAARRQIINDVWSEDGVYRNARAEYPGRDGIEPDSIGTHVAMLGADGRVVSDHQFIDKPPSGR